MAKRQQRRIPVVDKKGRLTGRFATREEIHKPGFKEIHPHAHLFLVNEKGEIGVQTRTIAKKYLGGKTIPLSAGGHLTDEDISQRKNIFRRPILYVDYKKGALRELKEELGIKKEPELTEIKKLTGVYDFTEHSGFPNKIYKKTFWALCPNNLKKTIKLNKLEVKEISWLSPAEIEKQGMYSNLDKSYAIPLKKEIEKVSSQVLNQFKEEN